MVRWTDNCWLAREKRKREGRKKNHVPTPIRRESADVLDQLGRKQVFGNRSVGGRRATKTTSHGKNGDDTAYWRENTHSIKKRGSWETTRHPKGGREAWVGEKCTCA